MLWNDDNLKKKGLINLFENYVFILTLILKELNNTIELIEDNIED